MRAMRILKQLPNETVGLLLQLLATVLGTFMSVLAKALGNLGVGVFAIILARSCVLLTATVVALWVQRVNPLKSNRKLLLLVRGLLGFGVITSIFWSVQLLPLSDATVLSRLSPLLIAMLAPPLLHEPPSPGVWLALPPCLLGVVLLAQPSFLFGGGTAGYSAVGLAVGLSQAVVQALTRISVRALGATEPSASIIFSGAAVGLLGSAVLCLLVPGQLEPPPSALAWVMMLSTGLLAIGLQVTSTEALKRARVSLAGAVNYISVVWGLLADLAIFGHLPTALSLLGAAMVCCSTLALAVWEGARSRSARGSGGGAGGEGGGSKEGGKWEGGGAEEGDEDRDGDGAGEEQRLLGGQEEGRRHVEQELVGLGGGASPPAARVGDRGQAPACRSRHS